MASASAVNEGINVKNKCDDPEIDVMALKMKEGFQKSASTHTRTGSAANVCINRAGKPVSLVPVAPLPSMVETSKEISEDSESVKSRFGWVEIGKCYVPFIIRFISNEYLKFMSVRIAENQLLSTYLNYLHPDIYTCTSVKSYYITKAEAKLLNEINTKFSEQVYGREPFLADKDYIVRLEDVQEFYTFVEVCYKKLLSPSPVEYRELCGFIRVNSESVVPYCIKDEQKYIPLFYFEGETENLRHRAVKLENWSLAYLKFCCKVLGIRNELFASDSCIVISLEDIKTYFPPDTTFQEFWPAKVVDTQLLTNQATLHVNPPAAWIKAPSSLLNNVQASENSLPRTLPVPAPSVVPPPSIPLTNYTYQNGWLANQMGPALQQVLQQSNGSLNNIGRVPPPPLIQHRADLEASASNPVVYANSVSINQTMTTMYNQMNTGSATSFLSNPMQFYCTPVSNHGQAMQQQQQQQQQSYVLVTTQPQQTYNNPSLSMNESSSRITYSQPRNALRNIAPAVTIPPSEIIDLSLSPSSPVPQNTPQDGIDWVVKKIPERPWTNKQHIVAYKILKGRLQGKTIHCINAKPFRFFQSMVTLSDLVQVMMLSCTVSKCAQVLNKYLKVTLYGANSEQLAVLRNNGRIKSLDDTPMAMLHDVSQVAIQLKNLLGKQDEQMQMHQGVGEAKRPRFKRKTTLLAKIGDDGRYQSSQR